MVKNENYFENSIYKILDEKLQEYEKTVNIKMQKFLVKLADKSGMSRLQDVYKKKGNYQEIYENMTGKDIIEYVERNWIFNWMIN